MSRFQNLLKNQIKEEEESGPQSQTVVSTPLRSLGLKREFNITTQGPYTQSTYLCTNILCGNEDKDCEQVIISYVEPDYDMEVGTTTSFPIELIFTELEGSIEDGTAPFWGRHALAIDKMYCFECPTCGFMNQYTLCKDGGILMPTVKYTREEMQVPKDRLMYITTPKSEWEME